ncbi:MAG TPA: tetratricopeptide repeat protein [Thermoanaerobaculia bacterium]|nr:tetratricopeptide repeat protein [Thermoanaerobaculia bacterium]
MIVERHYDDETLIGLVAARKTEATADPHLVICNSCSETLASYRAIAEVLGEDAVWDLRDLRNEPEPEMISGLRSCASAFAAEEEAAEAAVAALLGEPRSSWSAAIGRDLALQTPAVVKALVAASERAIDHVPADAVAIAALATHVAGLLPVEAYQGDTVIRARGTALRQQAYALFYVGDYPKAEQVIDEAHAAFEACLVSDYDLARLSVVRGLVLSAQERHDEARAAAREAAVVFEAFGDRQRYASARMAEAFSYMNQLRYRDALPVLESIERELATAIDSDARGRVVSNIAVCYSQLGLVAEALDHFQIAAAIYDENQNAPEAARVRYNVASLLALRGRTSDAKLRLRAVREDLQRLGMIHLSVSAGLDIAELLLAENAYSEAEALCASAVAQFKKLGLSATTQGMTALMYLQEAAAQRRATPQAARQIRKYIERLPKEPNLLFAPPSLPPY